MRSLRVEAPVEWSGGGLEAGFERGESISQDVEVGKVVGGEQLALKDDTQDEGAPNYILRSMLGRSSGPEHMPLHIDSFIPAAGSYCWSAQAAIVLEDQTEENGCTVAVPGSHRFDRYADQEAMALAEPIPSNTGDVVVWDSRLWHGARANKSGRTRWSLVGTFARWWLKQNYELTSTLPEAFYAGLTDEEKAIMGYCSIPPLDESERIDIKGGYEDLKPRVVDYRKVYR